MPDAPVSGTYREYYLNLTEKLKYLRDHLGSFPTKGLSYKIEAKLNMALLQVKLSMPMFCQEQQCKRDP